MHTHRLCHWTCLLLLTAPAVALADPGAATEVASREGANLQRPLWSPDGKQLSYEANFHDEKVIELYVGKPAGTFSRVLPSVRSSSPMTQGFSTGPKGGQVAHELSWSPPAWGKYVYSASNDVLDYELYISGGGALTDSPMADGGPAWSPDGNSIAFTSGRTGEGDIYLIDVRAIGTEPRRLTSLAHSAELFVSWSPDSQGLAYVAHSNTGDNLWVLPTLDGQPVQLTSWTGNQTRPRYSPDGKLIAFYANHDDPDRLDLWVASPSKGSEPRKLAEDVVPNATGPSWTPDGKALVAVLHDDDRFNPLVEVPAAGGTVKVLDLGTVGHGDLDVARDAAGKTWIAYVAAGRTAEDDRTFKRLFVAELPP